MSTQDNIQTAAAGDRSSHPYLFAPDGSWSLEPLPGNRTFRFLNDSITHNYVARRKFARSDTAARMVPASEEVAGLPYLRGHESWSRRWGLFFHTYSYSCRFPGIAGQMPVAPEEYMSPQTIRRWFGDRDSRYDGMNGAEIYDGVLSPASEEYCNWFNECYYREYCRVLSSGTGKRLTQQEEMDVIEKFRESLDFFDGTATVNSVSVIEAARLMDTATGGTAFSEAAADHADRWAETLSAREEELLAPFIYALRYTVTMPGRLTSANTALMDEGIPVWKVDGFRLLAGDLTIEATSSRANPLGFILLGLIVLVSAVVFFRLRR
ncbi:MAG TPA: hypothetical protein IAC94_00870 [Candidatus Coprenecus avistercoris]|uniref:Transmembrane protein n=1 Tax=Candidatus Coprenecus avistercoris TaxID=2840730 RepID=A0A9D1J5V9_9BACT|nr:hypothetical protein [Candidatus Coprenecus avistercoris]